MSDIGRIAIIPVDGVPEVKPGDPVEAIIAERVAAVTGGIEPGDIVVVTHKIISKAEGQLVDLKTIVPSVMATNFANANDKDPRHVEVVLRESRRIVRMVRGHIIAETRHGFVCANAGVDGSNIAEDTVSLLPEDPDASAARIRERLLADLDDEGEVGVIITDSFGRPWRNGIVNIAIGVSGMPALADYRGEVDPAGHELRSTVLAVADELASAAELVMHKISGIPVAVIRGYAWQREGEPGSAAELVMPAERDLFR